MSRIVKTGIVLVLASISLFVTAAPEPDVVPSLVRSGQWEQAYNVLQTQFEKETNGTAKALQQFGMGVAATKLNWKEKAQTALEQSLRLGTPLEDHAYFLLGKSLKDNGHLYEAKQFFLKAEAVKPRVTPLYYQAELELGEIAVKEEQWKIAGGHFNYLERKLRRDERYPLVLWNLIKIESARQKRWMACRWATKLYSRYPAHTLVKDWGVDLQKAEIDGKALGCVASLEDQKTRIKNLQMMGVNESAKKEIDVIKSRSTASTSVHADTLMASFLSSEGKFDEALNLLLPHSKKENSNFAYLMQLAQTSARLGEFQMAVGAYYRAYQLKKASKHARTALFQAAFLSYQFQDYDGAGRKFEELRKRFPKSGLARDAEWNLAWIHYLKGNYQGAFDGFKKLLIKKVGRRKTTTDEKALYWMAMSQLKMGKKSEAHSLFNQLTNDKLLGYYSLAATARLLQLKDVAPVRVIATVEKATDLLPTLAQATQDISQAEENESEDAEETLATTEESSEDEPEGESEGAVIAGEGVEMPFKNPQFSRHLKRAQDLTSLGLNQWATWDLTEIEKQTSSTSNLKTLGKQYEIAEAFNRSSYIAQIFFSKERSRGMTGDGKTFWQQAYPKAFEKTVLDFSSSFEVPREFVWGIMRAESHYKPDVKSPVGALGLMQIMPYTGRRLASILSVADFQPEQLTQPEVNIRLGSRYLQRLLKVFEQKIPLAAAAYNAGPHRVRAWLKAFGKLEMDEFVEHIPFLETRNYVKRVVHNYQVYRVLYAANDEAKTTAETLPWLAEPVGINVEGKVEATEDWSDL